MIFLLFFANFVFILGFTPAGDLIINDLHRVSDEVGQPARKALYIFSLYPFIDGVVRHISKQIRACLMSTSEHRRYTF